MTAPTPEKEKSTRARLSEWVSAELVGAEEIQIPALTEKAMRHFADDKGFVSALLRENVRSLIYEVVQTVVGKSRGELVQLGDAVVDATEFKARARRRSTFENWLEHVGDHHVRLLDMSREELLIAAKERTDRGKHELELARLWRAMAQRLEGGQQVREVFTAAEIESLRASLIKGKKEAVA